MGEIGEVGSESNEWVYCDPSDLNVKAPFCELFAISPQLLADVVDDMRLNGFKAAYPLVVWRNGNTIIDGHTRRQAAIKAALKDVPVCYMDFDSEDDAVVFAIKSQVKRRNLTEPELLRSIMELDKRKVQGGSRTGVKAKASRDAFAFEKSNNKTAAETGSILGISQAKVERARSVLSEPEIAEKVLSGEIPTINKGWKESVVKKREKREVTKKETKPKPNGRQARDYPMPQPAPALPPLPEIVRTPEDEIYLGTFPLRTKVIACRFDDDALLYREFGDFLKTLNGRLKELIEPRSPAGRSLLHKELHRLSMVLPIEEWRICPQCLGNGVACNKCHCGGYVIFD